MALPDDIRAACAARRGAARHVRIVDDASRPTRATLPAALAAGARPRGRRGRRGARRVLAHAQRDQLRLGLVPDAAQAARAVGLPHRRGGPARARPVDARRSCRRSTPREVAATFGQDPEHELMALFAHGAARARRRSSASTAALPRARPQRRRLRGRAGGAARGAGRPGATSRPTTAPRAVLQARPDRRRRPRTSPGLAPAADLGAADAVRRQPRPARAADRRRARVRRRSSSARIDAERAARARLARGGRDPRLRACTPSSCSSRRTASTTATAVDNVLWHRGAAPRYKAHPRHRARTTAY